LAHEIAAFPQIAMRSDRMSALRQWSLSEQDAIQLETRLSVEARQKEAQGGAARFASGAGRHGGLGKD
jgi:enoyl-CoA hydratase